ncbi:MAG: hypothetical protein AB2705_21150, partial [Candidatus Thiodiazotropha sp.]
VLLLPSKINVSPFLGNLRRAPGACDEWRFTVDVTSQRHVDCGASTLLGRLVLVGILEICYFGILAF